MSIKLPKIKLTRLDFYFLIYFFVSYFVITLIQGPSNDGSFSSELGSFSDGFYRSLVGGDEAVWDYRSTMLLNQGFCFNQNSSLLFGYYYLCNGYHTSSFLHVFVLSSIKLFVSFDYLVVFVKSFLVFLAFYSLFRFSRACRISSNTFMRCFSLVVLLVFLNPLFLWYSNTLLRDDYILLMSTLSLFLFCLRRSHLLGLNKYICALFVMTLLSVNYRAYLAFLPVILLLCEAFVGFLSLRIKALKLVLGALMIAIASFGVSMTSAYMNNNYALQLYELLFSFLRPLPTNVISLTMGEADPLKFVYIINFFLVVIFFGFLFVCLIRDCGSAFRDWLLPLFPLILFDIVYRLVLVSFHGDINGPRQCFGISSIELFVFAFGLMRFSRSPALPLSSKF